MTVNINAASISSARFVEQASNPATPSSGSVRLFVDNSTVYNNTLSSNTPLLKMIADDGTVTTFIGNVTTSGVGITFPPQQVASSNANTLDDYEEGTWTPAIRGSGIAGTYQTADAVGTYTKIGNRIHIFCTVTMAAVVTGGGTGYMQIIGLPVGIANAESATGAVAQIGLDMTAGYTWLTAGPASTSGVTWFFQECGDNQPGSDFPIAGIGANDSFTFSATYRL